MAPKKKTENKISLALKMPKDKLSKPKNKLKNVLKVKFQSNNLKNAASHKKKVSEEKSPAKVEMKKMLTMNMQNDPVIDRTNEDLKNAASHKKKVSEEKSPAKVEMKKMLTMNMQNDPVIDRTNEVARAQLVKECPVESTASAETPVVKKRGRKKKMQEPATADVVPKKKPKLPTNAKIGPKNTTKKAKKSPKATADVVPKKKPKLPTKAKVGPKNTTKKAKKAIKVAAAKRKAPTETAPSISPPPKRRRGRPLKKVDEDSTITSPSILSYTQPEIKTPDTDTLKAVQISPKPSNPAENNSGSRRTSVTSASAPASEWSWTKDISGSSTTTCITVNSNDFVRIDGKLPELKLNKLPLVEKKTEEVVDERKEPENSLSEDSSSSSSSSSSSPPRSETTAFENGVNLSLSSISPPPYSPTYTPNNQSCDKNKRDEVSSILEMLAPKLKSLDLDFADIESESEDFDIGPYEEKISTHLEEEYNAILECSFLNRILSESYVPETSGPEIEQKHSKDPDFTQLDSSVISKKSACDNLNDVPCNISRRRDTFDPYEDDDVLSIYADNVFDSTKLSSTASNLEEYVPQPLVAKTYTSVTYQPSRIIEAETASVKKPVCEKQNADSTSIHKEPELDNASDETLEPATETVLGQAQTDNFEMQNRRPPLTISYYTCPPGFKSATLRGVCFFNLLSDCRKQDKCFYPHRFIEEDEFKVRLTHLSEEQFFLEYNHIARRPILRRKYIKSFIDECQRRELPRILVEIVIDFLYKTPQNTPEDRDFRIHTVEHALIHLNKWSLVVCDKLLEYKVGDEVLCDLFMKIIANTQNFSRFKNVFINLTEFMVRTKRTFGLDVATHILERVCILRFEAPVASSLISIIGRTDKMIFNSNYINVFGLVLSTFNKELYNKFMCIREGGSEGLKPVSEPSVAGPPSLPSPCGSRGSREQEPLIVNPNSTQEQRYTSPDTTNTDSVNKPVTEPTIIRTWNHLNKIRPPNTRPPAGPLGMRGMARKWNQRSILSHIPRMQYMRQPRPMMRPSSVRSQFNFQRRYGPDFYGNSGP